MHDMDAIGEEPRRTAAAEPRLEDAVRQIRDMVVALLALEVVAGHISPAEVLEFVQDQSALRDVLRAARRLRGARTPPLMRLGPGGEFVRDIPARNATPCRDGRERTGTGEAGGREPAGTGESRGCMDLLG